MSRDGVIRKYIIFKKWLENEINRYKIKMILVITHYLPVKNVFQININMIR